MKTTLIIGLLFLVLEAHSTTLPQVSIDDLYKSAEFVGIVIIEEGKLIYNGEHLCAAKYTAKILESFKSPYKEGDLITFGPFTGKGVGQKYLLFLTKKEKQFKPIASTNSVSMAREREAQKICGPVLPELLVSFHGFGSLEIGTPSQFDYRDSIKIPDEYVAIPEELDKKAVEFGDDRILGDPYWINEQDFIKYMRKYYK